MLPKDGQKNGCRQIVVSVRIIPEIGKQTGERERERDTNTTFNHFQNLSDM